MAASIIRIVIIEQSDLNDPDITWNLTSPTLWSIVEILVGVACACFPAMRPLVVAIGKKLASGIPSISIHISIRSRRRSTSVGDSKKKMLKGSAEPSSFASSEQNPHGSFSRPWKRPKGLSFASILEPTQYEPEPDIEKCELPDTGTATTSPNTHQVVPKKRELPDIATATMSPNMHQFGPETLPMSPEEARVFLR
jgi:hypothetical protein